MLLWHSVHLGLNSNLVTVACSAARPDPQFQEVMVGVRQQLAARGADSEVQAYVEQVLLERHQAYKGFMTAEADKRRHLLDHVSKLEVAIHMHVACLCMCAVLSSVQA